MRSCIGSVKSVLAAVVADEEEVEVVALLELEAEVEVDVELEDAEEFEA